MDVLQNNAKKKRASDENWTFADAAQGHTEYEAGKAKNGNGNGNGAHMAESLLFWYGIISRWMDA